TVARPADSPSVPPPQPEALPPAAEPASATAKSNVTEKPKKEINRDKEARGEDNKPSPSALCETATNSTNSVLGLCFVVPFIRFSPLVLILAPDRGPPGGFSTSTSVNLPQAPFRG